MNNNKNQAFVKGALILMIANLLVKLIGAVFKIPLTYVLHEEGMGLFSSSYQMYAWMFVVSTAGIPVAISKMVAESRATGNHTEVKKILRGSLLLMTVIGHLGTAVLYFGAKPFSSLMKNEDAALGIAAVSPALLFVCIMSVFRGYFQGLLNMIPTAVSQLVEQSVKLITGLFFAKKFLPYGAAFAAAGATLGVTISEFSAFLVVAGKYLFTKKEKMTERNPESKRSLLYEILRVSVPITIGSCVMPIVSSLDSFVVTNALLANGESASRAASLFGLLSGFAVPVANMPGILTSSLAAAVVPALTASSVGNHKNHAEKQAKLCIKIGIFFGLPAAFGCYFLSQPILTMMYPRLSAEELEIASGLLKMLAPSILSLSIFQTLTGVLQGFGEMFAPIKGLVIGAVVKLSLSWFMIRRIGIYGAAFGTSACYLAAAFYAGIKTIRLLQIKQGYLHHFFLPLLSAWFMGLFASVIAKLIENPFASVFVSVLAAAVIYAILLFATGSLRLSEIRKGAGTDDKAFGSRNGHRQSRNAYSWRT